MERRTPWSFARLFVIALLVMVMVSVMGTVAFAQETDISAEKECYLTGDMNADGSFGPEDAIYTLYHTLFESSYPIRQNVDVNGDASVDTLDAIELLYATLFDYLPQYENYGKLAHDYYDPVWSWETADGVTATVTLQCACGEQSHTLDAEVTLGERVDATCTAAGYQVYVATVSDSDEIFTATYTEVIPAADHVAGETDFDEDQHYTCCANCGEVIAVQIHSWEENGAAIQGSCKVPTVQNYKCSSCDAVKSEQLGFAAHEWEDKGDVLVDGCQYAKKHECPVCGEVELTDYYENHTYVASIKEATCKEDGEKVYTCSACGRVDESRTEIIYKSDDKHVWDGGVEANGVITYTCTACGETKTAVVAKEDGTVTSDALQNADELEVGDATLSMDDDVKDGLGNNDVQITVDALKPEQLENILNADELAQIGNNTVYDFSLNVDGQEVSQFDGEITISLPYTLEEGEDIDGIDVWYINANGELVQQEATYSNGYVTFTTDHFSYYTVTRLTPEQRCARYDHIWTDASKGATCTTDGYTKRVCQRCTKEEVQEVQPAFGHDYKTTVTKPTCDKFGSTVDTCANCGHTKSSVTPALGHKLTLSETVEATCDAAGKYVFTCAHGCGHSTEQAIAQLTHDYSYSKSVDATCTTGGYDVYVCEYCGDEIKRNETMPTGHSFSAESAKWVWNKNASATLTLTCANDGCGSTKELKATITTVEASCLNDGLVMATVFYNNKTYTDEKAGGSATGHKPGAEWVITDKQHYFQCEACGEKIEAATHDLISSVTKEPTCVESGVMTYTCAVCGYSTEEELAATGKHSYGEGVVTKEPTCATKGTRVYTCTVCGKTREEIIPATGDHNYVDGKCSACGKVQSDCNHMKRTEKLIDVSGFGICEGVELVEISCECGEYRVFEFANSTCDLVEVFTEETAYGITEARQCSKCGLYAIIGQQIRFSTDSCLAEAVYWAELTMGDKTVAEFETVMDSAEHYVHIVIDETNVDDKTTCGLIVRTVACDCGERKVQEVQTNCDWSYNGYGDNAVCTVCGATREHVAYAPVADGCKITESWSYIYRNKAGEELYNEYQEYSYFEHDNEVTNFELYGDSCADGVWVEYTCTECGEVDEGYYTYHEMVHSTVTDLSNANICADAHIQHSCACGREKQETLVFSDRECHWAQIVAPGSDDALSTKSEYVCSTCGATMTRVAERSEKNENCELTNRVVNTYKDAKGNLLAAGERLSTYTEHNWKHEYELRGDSCTDGVTIIEYCLDCGRTNTWTIEHHEAMETVYDLSEFGFCGGVVREYKCPCGEESYVEVEPWGCDWTGMGDPGWEYHECLTCGAVWEINWHEEVIDACHSQTLYNHSFRKNGVEFLNIDQIERRESHRWVCELTLEGETCENGYHVKRTCLACGETEEYNGGGGCELYPVKREMLANTGLCGDVELVTYSCACGANTQTGVQWYNGECNFMHTGHGQEEDSYIYTCSKCGAIRYERNYHEQVPGEPECMLRHRWEYTYILNDVELFAETGTQTYYEHEMTYSFELLGETCDDGVIVSSCCKFCGYQNGEHTIYGHEQYGKTYHLSEYGFCGGLVEAYSCPCGENTSVYLDPYACNWQAEFDKEGHVKNVCANCGGIWETWYQEKQINDCITETHFAYSFRMGDQDLRLERIRKDEYHNWEFTYILLGETCENGVAVSRVCTVCGETSEYETYDHETYLKVHYELAEYGWCPGYLDVYTCACGENQHADWYSNCTWYGMGGYGDVDGFTERCGNCGMVWSWKWKTVEQIDSCTKRVENTVIFSKGDVIIAETWYQTQESHREICKLSLWEGSSSCEEGYHVEVYCQDCGIRTNSWGSTGYHETHIVAREFVKLDAKVCGTVERVTRACACGEKTYTEYLFNDCRFEDQYDEELGRYVYRCVNCGLTQISESYDVPVEGMTCQYETIETFAFLLNGEAVVSYTRSSTYQSHFTVSVQTLLGETCDDGYSYTWVCQYCGIEMGNSGINYGCGDAQRIHREKLAEKGVLCGDLYVDTYSCACGANRNMQQRWENGSCSFSGYWDQEQGCWIYTCDNCGVQNYYTSTQERVEGTTCDYLWTERNVYVRDGEELFTYIRTYVSTNHEDVARLELLGETCDDGYTVTWVCNNCGLVLGETSDVQYGCNTYTIDKQLLATGDNLCGDLYEDTYACACGKNSGSSWNWYGGSCWFEYVEYIEEEECYLYACAACGAYRKEYNEHTKLEGSECTDVHNWDYVYYNVNGEYLFTESGRDLNHNGTWVYTYYMLGETCNDGYLWSRTCAYCGEFEEASDPWYGCSNNLVEFIQIVPDSDTVCGPVAMRVYRCACGQNGWWNVEHHCSFYSVNWDPATGADTYECSKCGLTYKATSSSDRIPNSCLITETVEYTYWITDGEETVELGSLNKVFTRNQHDIVYELTLADGATSCEDGYYVASRCVYCDYCFVEQGLNHGHSEWRTTYYNLQDYGMCGGYVEGYTCACGEQERWNAAVFNCDYSYTGNQNAYGVEQRYCKKCNTSYYVGTSSELVEEECLHKYYLYAQLERDGEVLLDFNKSYTSPYHTMLAVGFDGTCENEMTVYYQCMYCGEQDTATGWFGHDSFLVDCLDLKLAGACDGYAQQYACPCGENTYVSWYSNCNWSFTGTTPEEIDGVIYYTQTRTCNDCGLSVVQTYHDTEKDENCRFTRVFTYEFRLNGELLKVMQELQHQESHEYELMNLELLGEDCEDGVRRTYTCKCGASYDNHYYAHWTYVDEERSVDLSQYGSVCGCKLNIYTCACGKYQNGELEGACDLDSRYANVWIDDALYINQPGTDGWISQSSFGYTYTCAVTDPQCGLGVRMAGVWLKGDNCTAARYEVWQLGYQEIYNEATGETTYTWETEIMIPTGYVSVYHDYAQERIDNREAGNGSLTESYICNDCGSSYITNTEYVGGRQKRHEVIAINTLDNGRSKKYHQIRENGFEHNGYLHETLERQEYIYADGSEYWYQNEVRYTSEDSCKYVAIYTNSNGYESIDEYEHYFTTYVWDWEKYPTCSQPGVEIRTEICELCQHIVDVSYFDTNPNRHDWWWDSEKGEYHCGTCGLENCNGADGTIVLEDLTAQYGNGTDYVLGYWNRGYGEFTVYASVVLDDAEDADELVLTGIDFNYLTVENDGINAVSTNQAVIAEAAAAAIADAGYTGSYAIRIAFVSADDGGMLDYAITFDSVMA